MQKEDVDALLKENTGRDVLIINRDIDRSLHIDLSKKLQVDRKNDKCTLFFTTLGGDPDGAYRIARCLRHYYSHIRLVIPGLCKSAGTLISIIADELAIGDLGELGPLDIQVRKDTELAEHSSGLNIIQALGTVLHHTQEAFREALLDIRLGGHLSTRFAGEFASKIAVGIAAPLYSQIDPIRIGETQRAMRILQEYGRRLDKYAKALHSGALNKLIVDYPAHSFVIDRKEAAELFRTVQHLSPIEHKFCNTYWHLFGSEKNFGPEFIVTPVTQENGTDDENQSIQLANRKAERLQHAGKPQFPGTSETANEGCDRVCRLGAVEANKPSSQRQRQGST